MMIAEGSYAVLGDGQIPDRRMLLKTSLGMALALLLAAPVTAESQAGKVYRIGFLGLSSGADYAVYLQASRQGLRDLGCGFRSKVNTQIGPT